jgi:hypothetical protein
VIEIAVAGGGVAAAELARLVTELSAGALAAQPAASAPPPPPQASLGARTYLRAVQLPPGTVVVLDAELSAPLLASAMGWSDVRRGVAAVSTAGLAGSPARVARLAAHEAGHLLGLRHCRSPGCLAHPVVRPEELDGLDSFCDRCRARLAP